MGLDAFNADSYMAQIMYFQVKSVKVMANAHQLYYNSLIFTSEKIRKSVMKIGLFNMMILKRIV